jgi:hypothetical protein
MAGQADGRSQPFTVLIAGCWMLASPAFADDPLACVDPAVAATLLAKPNEGRYTVTRSWPDRFAAVQVPREFTLVGSRVGEYRSIVAFRTELSPADAIARFESVGAGAGWEPPRLSSLAGRGFQLPRSRSDTTSTDLCKASIGHVAVEAFASYDGDTYVTVTGARHATSADCSQGHPSPGANLNLPVLPLPPGSRGSATGAVPESENDITSRAHLETSESVSAVIDYFSGQLTAQSWRRLSLWSHDTIHGSAWISADARSSALLTVIDQGDGRYELLFEAVGIR